LVMDRGFVKTKSISQFSKNNNNTFIRYEDLQTNEISNSSL
jgi:ribosomal protein S11